MGQVLPKKPLIEAIFELKWDLPVQNNGIQIDPNYNFLVGLYYEKIKNEFPVRVDLPTSLAPVDIFPYTVQFQFRKKENSWPLTQIGPGILTINDTDSYSWDNNFKKNCLNVIQEFYQSYPSKESLKIIELQLKYINAVEFDYKNNDIYKFLKENLNLNIELPKKILADKFIVANPFGYFFHFILPISSPKGAIVYRIAKGKKNDKDAIIIEILINSKNEDIVTYQLPYSEWLEEAHQQAEKSFYAFFDGNLLKEFKNEL